MCDTVSIYSHCYQRLKDRVRFRVTHLELGWTLRMVRLNVVCPNLYFNSRNSLRASSLLQECPVDSDIQIICLN